MRKIRIIVFPLGIIWDESPIKISRGKDFFHDF